jgi:hypothetical protein
VEKALKETPLAASLMEAIQDMRDPDGKVDVDLLEDIVKGKREERVDFIQGVGGLDLQPGSGFNLPASYRLDSAIAIYVHTLNEPPVYAVVNGEIFNTGRRKPGLRACLPYIKFLDAALDALPDCYVFQGAHTQTHTKRCSCGRRDRRMDAHKLSCTRQVKHGWKGQGLPDTRVCLTRHCLVKLPSSIALHLTASSCTKKGHVTHDADMRCRRSSSGRGAHSGSMGQQR